MECKCESCKNACRHKPGWFKPGEAERVAEYLGISLQELFDSHLGADWWIGIDDDIFVLAPANQNMTPGREYPGNPKGQCVFFIDGLCSIHPVKPFECRELSHDDGKDIVNQRHESVAQSWGDNQDQIEELLGRTPIPEETNITDFFLW